MVHPSSLPLGGIVFDGDRQGVSENAVAFGYWGTSLARTASPWRSSASATLSQPWKMTLRVSSNLSRAGLRTELVCASCSATSVTR